MREQVAGDSDTKQPESPFNLKRLVSVVFLWAMAALAIAAVATWFLDWVVAVEAVAVVTAIVMVTILVRGRRSLDLNQAP